MKSKWIKQLQVEVDASFLYQKLYEHNKGNSTAEIFLKMSEIENRHAQKVFSKIKKEDPNYKMLGPSLRARIQVKLAKYLGFDFILSHLAFIEYQTSKATIAKKVAHGEKLTGLENIHLDIIKNVSNTTNLNLEGDILSRFEGKHKTISGNELRAAVLGANDGLVSNLSLVTGVAGAAVNHSAIIVAGVAGLLAGAISMALGEWLSVQSSRELYQRQAEIEAEELENSPEEEMNELAILYQAKGMSEEDAKRLAQEIISNQDIALDVLLKEELGIDRLSLGGSAWKAAIASFLLFSVGAFIPIVPLFFYEGLTAMYLCLGFSALGLFLIGALITLYTGKHPLFSGIRQLLFGLAAAGITYTIGKWIGVSLAG